MLWAVMQLTAGFVDVDVIAQLTIQWYILLQKPSHILNHARFLFVQSALNHKLKELNPEMAVMEDLFWPKSGGHVNWFATRLHKILLFLCKLDSRARKAHYSTKDWPERIQSTVDQDNVKYNPWVEKDKIILPALLIKLGLFKNFVEVLHKKGQQ